MKSDFNINDRVAVMDNITGIISTGTIVGIEPDDEYDFNWLYLISDNPEMNDKFEQILNCNIWRIIEDISPYIEKKKEW